MWFLSFGTKLSECPALPWLSSVPQVCLLLPLAGAPLPAGWGRNGLLVPGGRAGEEPGWPWWRAIVARGGGGSTEGAISPEGWALLT